MITSQYKRVAALEAQSGPRAIARVKATSALYGQTTVRHGASELQNLGP